VLSPEGKRQESIEIDDEFLKLSRRKTKYGLKEAN
jgi:hypothetical protein